MAPYNSIHIHNSNEEFEDILSTLTPHEIEIDSVMVPSENNQDNFHGSRVFLLTVILISLCLICYYAVRIFRIVTGRDVDPPSRCMGQKGRQVHRPAIFVTTMRSPTAPAYSTSPTVYVTPLHHQPPPRYEASAPPSYDEVVGTHSPAAAQVRSQTNI